MLMPGWAAAIGAWIAREKVMAVALGAIIASLGVHGWLVVQEIDHQQNEHYASGIGKPGLAPTPEAVRVDACQNAEGPEVDQKTRRYIHNEEKMALLNYCAAVRANELASSAGSLTGLATLFSLLSTLFAVLALMISIRVERAAINRQSP